MAKKSILTLEKGPFQTAQQVNGHCENNAHSYDSHCFWHIRSHRQVYEAKHTRSCPLFFFNTYAPFTDETKENRWPDGVVGMVCEARASRP